MAELPIHERPRERLLAHGAEALSERELLALVLRHGSRGESALGLAAALLAEYGGLARLAAARPEELARRQGVGDAKATALVAAFRLGRLVANEGTVDVQLQGPHDVFTASRLELAGRRREHVLVLVCDAGNHLRRTEAVAEGSIDRSALPVREVLNCVLRHDGRAFAVAHNHPSGDPTPSEADVLATRALAAAAKVVGLRFLDHIVVAGDHWERIALTAGLRTRN
ncbi:MAG: DNA repair protein RadC [Actinomycetota bacterium]|nr:DNA repair protein RadC [Actinomycetota bacterium]